MAGSFNHASEQSKKQFEILKPHLIKAIRRFRNFYNCKDIVNIESDNNVLDIFGGIDAIGITDNNMTFGIALRIQTGPCYRTFTIRTERDSGTKTEYEKRAEAIMSGDGILYPILTVQAYFDDETTLTSFAVVDTRCLIKNVMMKNCQYSRTGSAQYGQAEFAVVSWDRIPCCVTNILEANL